MIPKPSTVHRTGATPETLSNQDLTPHIEAWHTEIKTKFSKDTADDYKGALISFKASAGGLKQSDLTFDNIQNWLDAQTTANNTRRKKAAGIGSWCRWLIQKRLLADNPMRNVELPALGKPRKHYLSTEEAEILLKDCSGDLRNLEALMAGSGVELSVAIKLTVADVTVANQEVFAKGTKTATRERMVTIASWAWPYVLDAIKGKKKTDKLFPSMKSRWVASKLHREVMELLVISNPEFEGYTLRDHRHTYAVRAMQAGTPAQLVATQLGHANSDLGL